MIDAHVGDSGFERIVGKDHFLVALKAPFGRHGVGAGLIPLCDGKGTYARPPRDLARVMGTERTATVHYWLVALEEGQE